MIANKRLDIQGLRAVAVASVVLFHAGLPVSGGFVGVDVFFVISGYVIASMLLRELQSTGAISLQRFYTRRFKRLMPALSLVVVVSMVASTLLFSPLGPVVRVAMLTGIASIFALANVVIATLTGGYFDAGAETNPFLHTWSLAVEEQFYFVFPALMLWLAKTSVTHGKYRQNLIVVSLSIVSFWGATRSASGHFNSAALASVFGFYSPVSRFWEFAVGALLAMNSQSLKDRLRTGHELIALAGMLMLLISFFLIGGKTVFPGPMTLLPVFGTAAIIMAGMEHEAPMINRLLSSRPFVRLGDVSYSWYLWHWPPIVLVAANGGGILPKTCAAFVSLVPAFLSYVYVEEPIRHAKVLDAKRWASIIAGVFVPVIAVGLVVIYANRENYWSETIRDYKVAVETVHASNNVGCGQGYVPSSLPDGKCTWNPDGSGVPLYLFGDSNADHLSEAAIDAANALGSSVSIISKGGCAILGRSWESSKDDEQDRCNSFVDESFRLLTSSKPGLVIIGMSDSLWWRSNEAVGPSSAERIRDHDRKMDYLRGDLVDKISTLQSNGHKVLLVKPVAKFVTEERKLMFDTQNCSTLLILSNSCPRRVTVSIEYEDQLQQHARRNIDMAAEVTASDMFDARAHLCGEDSCSNADSAGLLYRDAGHLTIRATRIVSTGLQHAILAALD